jgi:hypothetical protein
LNTVFLQFANNAKTIFFEAKVLLFGSRQKPDSVWDWIGVRMDMPAGGRFCGRGYWLLEHLKPFQQARIYTL